MLFLARIIANSSISSNHDPRPPPGDQVEIIERIGAPSPFSGWKARFQMVSRIRPGWSLASGSYLRSFTFQAEALFAGLPVS